jgi:signal transduction histidine kinase
MRSLRTRLFVYLIGGAAILFLAVGLALTTVIAAWLQRDFDRALLARARGLMALTEQQAGQIEFDVEPEHLPEFGVSASPEYFELRLVDGSLLARSRSFEASDSTRRASLIAGSAPAITPAVEDLRLPDGRRGRRVRIDFVPALDTPDAPDEAAGAPGGAAAGTELLAATLVVAREREGLDADLDRLRLAVAAVALGLMAALAALTQLALRVGLRSLERLTHQVRALDASSLSTRVAVEAPPAEIAVVVEQVNALLARLEAGFNRERRLSSDAAHELKTPIAELRSLCDVGARWPGDRAAARAFFEDARAIALQMERIVVQLLALARCEEGREQVTRVPVRVAEVVDAAWKPLAREAVAKRVELRQDIAPPLCFETDPDKFALIVANLLSNALAYSPPGSAVLCTSHEANGRSSVSVANRAEDLEPQDLAVMFDRFWRKDEARTGGRSAGLGLSLVRALADLLDIRIETRLEADRTFRITLSGTAAGK